MRCTSLTEAQQRLLLETARESIRHGCEYGRPLAVNPQDYQSELRQPRASFVTLQRHDRLRGCIGSLEAHQALVVDVAENAYAAGFRDPRFAPVGRDELEGLRISLSLLTPPESMRFESEADLLGQIVPGEDGLVIREDGRRATFLPAVWQSLPDPVDFLRELKRKAGLHPDHWSDRLRVERYHAEHVDDSLALTD